MLVYAIRRILLSIPVLLVSTFVVFLLVSFSGDPLSYLRARNPPPPPQVFEVERERLHLDEPLLERYWTWLSGIVRGDFGPSVQRTFDIGPELASAFFVTMRLILVSIAVALLLAVIVGVVSAVRQYTKTDYTFTFLGFLFLSMPVFWFAVLLKEAGISFNNAVDRQVLFTIGDSSVYVEGGAWAHFVDVMGHMVLPVVALSLVIFASWSRFQRASMLEVLNSDYVRLARAKGLRWRKVLVKHGLRTALIPLTTQTAVDFATLIGTTVITETVFQWRAMGTFLVDAINRNDVFAVEAWLLIAAAMVIAFNLLADLLYAVLDPRIRYD